MSTRSEVEDMAREILRRCGEAGIAGVVLKAQEAHAAGDRAQMRQWWSIAEAMLGLRPAPTA